MPTKELFVSSIPYETTEDELRPLFAEFGPVERIHLLIDRETGHSKGYGFITMATEEAAERAKQPVLEGGLHGHTICGRRLRVVTARPKGEKSDNGRG